MSIDPGNLNKESYTFSEQQTKYIFGRRRFPPSFDPLQDTSNREKKKIFFSSIVYLRQPSGDPMDFCGGVACYFDDLQVQALCFTDYIVGLKLKNFDIIVSSFVCIFDFQGTEVLCDRAFLFFGEVDEVRCRAGILYRVKANTVHVGAAVVLYKCEVKNILFDRALCEQSLCSKKKILGKQLEIDLSRPRSVVFKPMVELVKMQTPTTISQEINVTVKEDDSDEALWIAALTSFINIIMYFSKGTINLFNNRGASWHYDLLEGASRSEKCLICLERLPLFMHDIAKDESSRTQRRLSALSSL